MDAIHTEEYKGYTIEIHQDQDTTNPREDGDGYLSVIVCWHRRDNYGDDKSKWDEQWETPQDFEAWAIKNKVVYMPVFLYDHTIQRLSTRSFLGRAQHAEWDSGQIGFTYMKPSVWFDQCSPEGGVSMIERRTQEEMATVLRGKKPFKLTGKARLLKRLKAAFKSRRVTKTARKAMEADMIGELQTYDDWVGNVYGYVVNGPELDGESCWGFIGDYDGEYGALSEAKSVVDSVAKKEPVEKWEGRNMAL